MLPGVSGKTLSGTQKALKDGEVSRECCLEEVRGKGILGSGNSVLRSPEV